MGGKEAARIGGGEAQESRASQEKIKAASQGEEGTAALKFCSIHVPVMCIPFLIEP